MKLRMVWGAAEEDAVPMSYGAYCSVGAQDGQVLLDAVAEAEAVSLCMSPSKAIRLATLLLLHAGDQAELR